MVLQYFWLIVLLLVILWYLIVTILVGIKGFGSLSQMLREYGTESDGK